MLRTAAASAASEAVVSSWKLETSSTHKSAARPASSRRKSASSTAGPMFPAISQSSPAAFAIAPASEVTVLLPLVPVTAMIRARLSGAPARTTRCRPRPPCPHRARAAPWALRAARPGWRRRGRGRRTFLPGMDRNAPEPTVASASGPRGAAGPRAYRRLAPARPVVRATSPSINPCRPNRAPAPFCLRDSPQLQSRQTEQDHHHDDDPEPHDDLRLLQPQDLALLIHRPHPKNPLP